MKRWVSLFVCCAGVRYRLEEVWRQSEEGGSHKQETFSSCCSRRLLQNKFQTLSFIELKILTSASSPEHQPDNQASQTFSLVVQKWLFVLEEKNSSGEFR